MLATFFTLDFFVSFLMAAIGTTGFALLFNSRAKYLLILAIGGALTYAVYYFFEMNLFRSIFAAAFFSSAFSAVYSELFARIKCAPTIICLIPCAIPIVPGSSLYYAMASLISRDMPAALRHLSNAALIGIGIAGGIMAVSILMNIYTEIVKKHKL